MNAEEKLNVCRGLVEGWIRRQGHDRCWYYPAIFLQLCDMLGVDTTQKVDLPRREFEAGCRRYQEELYGRGYPPGWEESHIRIGPGQQVYDRPGDEGPIGELSK